MEYYGNRRVSLSVCLSPLGHAQGARCDVLYKPSITTHAIHNLASSCRVLFHFGIWLQGLFCARSTNTGFFVVLKPVTRRITGTYEKDFQSPGSLASDLIYDIQGYLVSRVQQ